MYKVFQSMMVVAVCALCTAAHAQQVMGSSCPDENNGTFGATASHQDVLCANGTWQDAKTLGSASVAVAMYDKPTTQYPERTLEAYRPVGVRSVQQIGAADGKLPLTLVTKVVGFNPDNTARVVVDIYHGEWQKHVDTPVPLGKQTAIAIDESGAQYRVTVKSVS
ncbi:hypothetical protein [Paraburkholderia sp. SIMBA_054]|uniref:hypothetical protein n=1 Tax=Paraburkholderia sp. SIMBA_054 TaxID=3085795 RepID=UPI00397C2C11